MLTDGGVNGLARRLARVERLLQGAAVGPQLAYSSLEGGALGINDDMGTYRGAMGTQFDGTVALTAVNGPTPPRPAPPAVVGFPLVLQVGWDGNFLGDDGQVDPTEPAPEDFARVEVHFGAADGFAPEVGPESNTRRATIETAAGATVTISAVVGDYWVRLVTVTTSGKFAVSDSVMGTVQSVLGQDVVDQLNQELADANQAITDTNERIDGISVGATPSHMVAPAATDTAVQGTIWRQVDASGAVIGVWEQTGAGTAAVWTPRPVTSAVIDNLDVGKLVAGTAELGDAVAQKIAAKTATFIELDVSQLTVVGTATISDLVAESIAGKTGQFVRVAADQIDTGVLGASVSITAGDPVGAHTVLDFDGITSYGADGTTPILDTSGAAVDIRGNIAVEGPSGQKISLTENFFPEFAPVGYAVMFMESGAQYEKTPGQLVCGPRGGIVEGQSNDSPAQISLSAPQQYSNAVISAGGDGAPRNSSSLQLSTGSSDETADKPAIYLGTNETGINEDGVGVFYGAGYSLLNLDDRGVRIASNGPDGTFDADGWPNIAPRPIALDGPIAGALSFPQSSPLAFISPVTFHEPVIFDSPAILSGENWHYVGYDASEPNFQNGWTAASGSLVGFRKDSAGVVHLTGSVENFNNSTTIFQLPPGYRPSVATGNFLCFWQSASPSRYCGVRVYANGEVHAWKHGNDGGTYADLDSVAFLAA